MDVVIHPHPLAGTVTVPPSKSVAHRLLICAALSSGPTDLGCAATNDDIDATIACLEALGAAITADGWGFRVEPIRGTDASDNLRKPLRGTTLPCGESGSTLRFLLPVACALGADGTFVGQGRLSERPIAPLDDVLAAHGVTLERPADRTLPLTVEGTLQAGRFTVPGDISSQYISGLLMAAPLLGGPSEIRVEGTVASLPYVELTLQALERFSVEVDVAHEDDATLYLVSPTTPYVTPGTLTVEGDWSAAAFWLGAGALGQEVSVAGLDRQSVQGDRAMVDALTALGAQVAWEGSQVRVAPGSPQGHVLDMEDTPDLVPPLAVACALTPGTTTLTGTARLRLKESDRLVTVAKGLEALGAQVAIVGDDLVFQGVDHLEGGTVDAAGDHRIAMMGAIAATVAKGPVTILGADCVSKSYPAFWDHYRALGATIDLRP